MKAPSEFILGVDDLSFLKINVNVEKMLSSNQKINSCHK